MLQGGGAELANREATARAGLPVATGQLLALRHLSFGLQRHHNDYAVVRQNELLALPCGFRDTYRGLFRLVGYLYETSGGPVASSSSAKANAGVGAGRAH